jgi:hypothetical protein
MLRCTIPLLLFPVLFAEACSSSTPVTACTVGADCASGACGSDGQCIPVGGVDGGGGLDGAAGGGGGGGGGAGADSGPPDGSPPPDAPFTLGDGGLCTPQNNGTIQASEVPMTPGLRATFVIAENVTVDTAGTTQPDGTRVWDYSGALAGDHSVVVTTDPPTGQWFSGQYPSATYTTKLSDTQPLLGVFQGGTTALLLQGIVSPSNSQQSSTNELTYNPFVTTLAFPLKSGASWSTNAEVTGTADGVPVVPGTSYDDYQSSVDATGKLTVPYSTTAFPVQRVKTLLTRTIGATVTVYRSFAFVTECFGTIASVTSGPDESSDEFTNAAEIRRLGQ